MYDIDDKFVDDIDETEYREDIDETDDKDDIDSMLHSRNANVISYYVLYVIFRKPAQRSSQTSLELYSGE